MSVTAQATVPRKITVIPTDPQLAQRDIRKKHLRVAPYQSTYFRIRSRYQFDSGWPDEGAERAFREESRALFQSAGWELHPARADSGSSDTVTKGQQELYLHPMNFSGVIRSDEIPRLQALLAGAQTFQCQGVDCYERYWDLTDAANLERLEAQLEDII